MVLSSVGIIELVKLCMERFNIKALLCDGTTKGEDVGTCLNNVKSCRCCYIVNYIFRTVIVYGRVVSVVEVTPIDSYLESLLIIFCGLDITRRYCMSKFNGLDIKIVDNYSNFF